MNLTEIETLYRKRVVEYDKLFDETVDLMEIDRKVAKEAIKNQIILEMNWELMSKKLNYVYDQCELETETKHSESVKVAMTDKFREITLTEARIHAKANAGYKAAISLLHEIRRTRDECRGMLDSVRSRKYLLNNLTSLIVAGAENHIL